MSEAKFTKGEWRVNKLGSHHNNSNLEHIEICYSDIGECICDTVYEESDAHLIAAAPEMYAALTLAKVTLANVWKNTGSLGCKAEIESIDEVLAKARGE